MWTKVLVRYGLPEGSAFADLGWVLSLANSQSREVCTLLCIIFAESVICQILIILFNRFLLDGTEHLSCFLALSNTVPLWMSGVLLVSLQNFC